VNLWELVLCSVWIGTTISEESVAPIVLILKYWNLSTKLHVSYAMRISNAMIYKILKLAWFYIHKV
jgi:hypothetical protein